MLLIKNFDQFLDALNLCDTGIYTYDEVIADTPINSEEVLDYAYDIPLEGCSKLLLERKHFKVQLITLTPGDSLVVNEGSQKSWLKCIRGSIEVSTPETNLKTDQTMNIVTGQVLVNKEEKTALAILVST